jgi:hypothetical protein
VALCGNPRKLLTRRLRLGPDDPRLARMASSAASRGRPFVSPDHGVSGGPFTRIDSMIDERGAACGQLNSITVTNLTSVYSKLSRVFGFPKILPLENIIAPLPYKVASQ